MPRPKLLALTLLVTLVAAPLLAQSDDDNGVCKGGATSMSFNVKKVGELIEGTWTGVAPGIGHTTGVQTFQVDIEMQNGRPVLKSNGRMTRLNAVQGPRKALRYDFVNQRALPEEAHAVKVSIDDFGLTTGCDMAFAPQFAWQFGSGSRRSNGIYSFASPTHAIGTMWNSAQGAREVYLSR